MHQDITDLIGKPKHCIEDFIRSLGALPEFQPSDPQDGNINGYYTPYDVGLEAIIGEDDMIDSIMLYSDGHHDASQFDQTLPCNLDFSMTREEIIAILREPNESGGPTTSPLEPTIIIWDLWHFSQYSLHCEYPQATLRLQMVTLMLPEDRTKRGR